MATRGARTPSGGGSCATGSPAGGGRGGAGGGRGLAGLGELGAAVERVQVGGEAALLFLGGGGGLGLHRLLGVRREPELEHVARRDRMVSAVDNDVAEHVLEDLGVTLLIRGGGLGGGTAEQAAQEPARAVGTHEPDRPHPGLGLAWLRGHPRDERDAERSVRFLAAAARGLYLGGDLGPDVIPERVAAGSGERLH